MALIHGGKSVTSVDYGKIQCDDSRILVMTHKEMNEKYLKGSLAKFDVVISYSSLEHSGLGRYVLVNFDLEKKSPVVRKNLVIY